MHGRWVRVRYIAAVLLAFALAGCDSGADILAPEQAGADDASARYGVVHGNDHGAQARSAHASESALVEKVIGPGGGNLTLGEHSLYVPRGAVTRALRFRMTLIDPSTVTVDLAAVHPGKVRAAWQHGGGSADFERPVTLTLSYAGLGFDPSTLAIVWKADDHDYGSQNSIESWVDEENETVSAKLYHFSLYALAD